MRHCRHPVHVSASSHGRLVDEPRTEPIQSASVGDRVEYIYDLVLRHNRVHDLLRRWQGNANQTQFVSIPRPFTRSNQRHGHAEAKYGRDNVVALTMLYDAGQITEAIFNVYIRFAFCGCQCVRFPRRRLNDINIFPNCAPAAGMFRSQAAVKARSAISPSDSGT